MQELTREEWEKVAERLGVAAEDLDEVIKEKKTELAEEHEELEEWRELVKAMRLAAGAVLWVAEYAADRCRFVMLDAHPPDEK